MAGGRREHGNGLVDAASSVRAPGLDHGGLVRGEVCEHGQQLALDLAAVVRSHLRGVRVARQRPIDFLADAHPHRLPRVIDLVSHRGHHQHRRLLRDGLHETVLAAVRDEEVDALRQNVHLGHGGAAEGVARHCVAGGERPWRAARVLSHRRQDDVAAALLATEGVEGSPPHRLAQLLAREGAVRLALPAEGAIGGGHGAHAHEDDLASLPPLVHRCLDLLPEVLRCGPSGAQCTGHVQQHPRVDDPRTPDQVGRLRVLQGLRGGDQADLRHRVQSASGEAAVEWSHAHGHVLRVQALRGRDIVLVLRRSLKLLDSLLFALYGREVVLHLRPHHVRPGAVPVEAEQGHDGNLCDLCSRWRFSVQDRVVHDGVCPCLSYGTENSLDLLLELDVGNLHSNHVLAVGLREVQLLAELVCSSERLRRTALLEQVVVLRGIKEGSPSVLDRSTIVRAEVVDGVPCADQPSRHGEARVHVARHLREDEEEDPGGLAPGRPCPGSIVSAAVGHGSRFR
mmetsp:Transcript_84309/g.263414  ORF Transcript_84309/g.263414 Transcript_84309/m.263414 type:complete len:511 (+) Transcript_84309:57-1589(+)